MNTTSNIKNKRILSSDSFSDRTEAVLTKAPAQLVKLGASAPGACIAKYNSLNVFLDRQSSNPFIQESCQILLNYKPNTGYFKQLYAFDIKNSIQNMFSDMYIDGELLYKNPVFDYESPIFKDFLLDNKLSGLTQLYDKISKFDIEFSEHMEIQDSYQFLRSSDTSLFNYMYDKHVSIYTPEYRDLVEI